MLFRLKVAAEVNELLGIDAGTPADAYDRIQSALAAAVHSKHVPWDDCVTTDALDRIRAALREYRYVFSTNYDLIVYWAVMRDPEGEGFVDYLWNPEGFKIEDSEVFEGRTRTLYLHGALYLVKTTGGHTSKLRNTDVGSILSQFGVQTDQDAIPLIVTEGDSSSELNSIRSTDYLLFAFERFAHLEKPLVIFGHRMGDSDIHLVNAIRGYRGRDRDGNPRIKPGHLGRRIVISLLATGNQKAEMARYNTAFPEARLSFFDAASHPLGAPDLRVG